MSSIEECKINQDAFQLEKEKRYDEAFDLFAQNVDSNDKDVRRVARNHIRDIICSKFLSLKKIEDVVAFVNDKSKLEKPFIEQSFAQNYESISTHIHVLMYQKILGMTLEQRLSYLKEWMNCGCGVIQVECKKLFDIFLIEKKEKDFRNFMKSSNLEKTESEENQICLFASHVESKNKLISMYSKQQLNTFFRNKLFNQEFCYESDELEKNILLCEKVLEILPSYSFAKLQKAMLLYYKNNFEEADKLFYGLYHRGILSQIPYPNLCKIKDDRASVLIRSARGLYENNEFEKAKLLLEKVINNDFIPMDSLLEEAKELFERILEQNKHKYKMQCKNKDKEEQIDLLGCKQDEEEQPDLLDYEQDEDEASDFLDYKQDERGIFYLLSYYEDKDFVLSFKNGDNFPNFVTVVGNIVYNLKKLIPSSFDIVLTSVPSSKSGKWSSMDYLIKWIVKEGLPGMVDWSDYNFYDGSEVFLRERDVTPLHKLIGDERKDATRKNMKTISCSIDGFSKRDVYVILDDVTTTGGSLLGCKRKLMEQGVAEDDIICFALAKTEWRY